MITEHNEIFPRALITAARTFADRPKVVGEILIALATDTDRRSLSDVQRYILAQCEEEIAERRANRDAKRQAWAEKTRRQRMAK